MIKGVTYAHLGPIWNFSESSDVPYFPNQYLGWDYFCCFLQQTGSSQSFLAAISENYRNNIPLVISKKPKSQKQTLSTTTMLDFSFKISLTLVQVCL